MPTDQPTPATRCSATYPSKSRDPNTRIVHCHLEAGHPGEHEEEGTEVTWLPDEPRDRGICGVGAPTLFSSAHGGLCALLAGHAGWHAADGGMSWTGGDGEQ